MNFILQLKLRNIDGVLERVLGVVRYRGYQILKLMANPSPDGKRMEVTLKVGSKSKSNHLPHHLKKLLDVEALEIYGEMTKVRFG